MPKGQLSDKAAQAQHICGGCPTCSPTDTKRANTTEALADDSPPEPPGGSVGGSNGLSAGSSPGSTDTAAKAHSPRESSGSNAQQGALSPEFAGKLAAQASSQGGAGDATTPTTGVSPAAQFQQGVSIGGGSGEVTAKATPKVEFTYASPSSTVTSSQPLSAPTTASFTASFPASQPTQSFTASGAGVSAAAQTTSAQGRIEVNADTRQALHRTSSREELQSPTPAAPRRELEGFAPRRVPGETGVVQRLAPESASREMVRAGTSVAEGRSAPQRHENLAGERVVQGRPPKERSEAAEQRGEFAKRPETATKQDSPTLRREATQDGAIRGGRMQSDAVPRDLSPNRTARTGSARVETVRIDTARVNTVRVDTVRANSSRVDSPRVDSPRIEPMRGSSARVERFMGWASDRLSSSHTPTARTSEHLTSERPVWRQQRSEPAQRQRTEVAPAPVIRGQTVAAHSSADRRIERATPLTESVPVQRVGLRPEGVSGTQRASHSVAVPQSRTSRSEASSTERVKQRYDVPVHRRELKESRTQRDLNRGDRTVERTGSQVRVDSAVKRGESATRSAESRRSTERAAAVPRDNQRSSPRSREALQARSAALRQAIFERINRIVTSAERLRRSNSTALASMQQLELAARIVELLGEEEYEGISELRSRERSGVSAVRVLKRRKTTSNKDQEQYDTRLKSLKALKKQRAARASVQAAAVQSGEAKAGAAGVATQSGAAPGSALGKNVSASRGAPSKTLDIFQAKTDDDTSRDEREGEYSSERSAPSCD